MKIEINKPVVPAWFDEWYKTFNDDVNKGRALYYLNRTGWGHDLIDGNECKVADYYDKLEDLLGEHGYDSAKEYLSKAILFGYEIEQEPLYYAKVKGWELTNNKNIFWNYRSVLLSPMLSRLYVGDKESNDIVKTKLTKEEWDELGINDTNAEFREVG